MLQEIGEQNWASLSEGLTVLREAGDGKWDLLNARVLDSAAPEKVVLFAQPIETVTALAAYLQRACGETPAVIVGGQSDEQRQAQIDLFWRADGPRFLVSSRAGGEGINLQIAHRLVHIACRGIRWNWSNGLVAFIALVHGRQSSLTR